MFARLTLGLAFALCSAIAAAEDKLKIEGSWCANPCVYASSRPWDMPCRLDIDSDTIHGVSDQYFERKYTIADHTSHSISLIVDDGRDWYTGIPAETTKWKLTFEPDHGNEFARDSLLFSAERDCSAAPSCSAGVFSSLYVSKREDKCNGEDSPPRWSVDEPPLIEEETPTTDADTPTGQ